MTLENQFSSSTDPPYHLMNVPAAQQLRFRRPTKKPVAEATLREKIIKLSENKTLFNNHLLRLERPGWLPSYLVAFRIIILIRFFAGMYSGISDCDEVYNYWEPLHYLLKGSGFQTWEYSPLYAIRSYFYLLLHYVPLSILQRVFENKRVLFFALRLIFATVSSACEAALYSATAQHVSPFVARYLLAMLVTSAGMYSAATSFLPSTFAMYFVTLGFAQQLRPASPRTVISGAILFATGAIVGWPFAAVLALPFAAEQLASVARFRTAVVAAVAAAAIALPVIYVDSAAYRKLTFVPWNIVKYNVFPTPGRGPTLYGEEPANFYYLNGILNFNVLFPLAILSLPLLIVVTRFDPKRISSARAVGAKLAPFYLWLSLLTQQAHKEERFMFPAYTLVLFNASVALYLIRSLFEVIFLRATQSPWLTRKTPVFALFTRCVLVLSTILSLGRIFALRDYYSANLRVFHHFQLYELPRQALISHPEHYTHLKLNPYAANITEQIERADFDVDLAPLAADELTLCLGKEWHRFPSHFQVPSVVNVNFIESEFKGILPKHWQNDMGNIGILGRATANIPTSMNDLNEQERDRFVDVNTCHYLVDLDFPHRTHAETPLEPRYIADADTWERVACFDFLDKENSNMLTRAFKVGDLKKWQEYNSFGDYCLLKNKHLL